MLGILLNVLGGELCIARSANFAKNVLDPGSYLIYSFCFLIIRSSSYGVFASKISYASSIIPLA